MLDRRRSAKSEVTRWPANQNRSLPPIKKAALPFGPVRTLTAKPSGRGASQRSIGSHCSVLNADPMPAPMRPPRTPTTTRADSSDTGFTPRQVNSLGSQSGPDSWAFSTAPSARPLKPPISSPRFHRLPAPILRSSRRTSPSAIDRNPVPPACWRTTSSCGRISPNTPTIRSAASVMRIRSPGICAEAASGASTQHNTKATTAIARPFMFASSTMLSMSPSRCCRPTDTLVATLLGPPAITRRPALE